MPAFFPTTASASASTRELAAAAMLEAVIPAVWSAVHGWFTPAVLFVVLNIVIGTIAVTSKVAAASSSSSAGGGEGDGAGAWAGGGGGGENRRLSGVPSMALDRLRSFNLSGRFAAAPAAPEPAVAGVLDLAGREEAKAVVNEVGGEREREREREEEEHAQAAHVERSRSEAAAAAKLPRLPARLRKSASDLSAFAHFEAEKKEEEEREAAVEARLPATTREPPRVWLRVADDSEPEESDGEAGEPEMDDDAGAGEVDARADDFINNFRHQLKLQRIDSYLRHRDMLRRGHAAAAAVGSD